MSPTRYVFRRSRTLMINRSSSRGCSPLLLIRKRLNRVLTSGFQTGIDRSEQSTTERNGSSDGPPVGDSDHLERGRNHLHDQRLCTKRKNNPDHTPSKRQHDSFPHE